MWAVAELVDATEEGTVLDCAGSVKGMVTETNTVQVRVLPAHTLNWR